MWQGNEQQLSPSLYTITKECNCDLFVPQFWGFIPPIFLRLIYTHSVHSKWTRRVLKHTDQLRFAAWHCPSEQTTQAFNFHYWPCGFIGLPGNVIANFPLDSSGKHGFYIINFSAFFKVSLMKLAWPIKLTVDI